MNWNDPNDAPHGILKNGQPTVLGLTGERNGYLWYWAGTEHLTTIKGATFNPESGRLSNADGTIHGWVSPITDMEEIADDNAANGEWSDMRELAATQHFQEWLAARLKMADNETSG